MNEGQLTTIRQCTDALGNGLCLNTVRILDVRKMLDELDCYAWERSSFSLCLIIC